MSDLDIDDNKRHLRNLPRKNYYSMSRGGAEKVTSMEKKEPGEDVNISPLGASGDLGEFPHSKDKQLSDTDELTEMREEMRRLQDEERRLKKAAEVDTMRRRLEVQRQRVQTLRGNTDFADRYTGNTESLHYQSDSREVHPVCENNLDEQINIERLRQNTELRRKVRKELKKHCLLSDSDDESDFSDISSDDSITNSSSDESKRKKKHRKHKSKRSGIKAKASDRVKHPQKWPQSHLQFEYVNKHVKFEDLDFKLFIAGELEIISDERLTATERSGRLALLKKIVYYYSTYEFKGLKAFYAAWLREIELGKKKWSDDPQVIESAILSKHLLRSTKLRNTATRKSETDQTNETVWFCQLFQRNKCLHKSNHTEVLKGKMRLAQHICATCWLKDRKKLGHPECSSSCPHATS